MWLNGSPYLYDGLTRPTGPALAWQNKFPASAASVSAVGHTVKTLGFIVRVGSSGAHNARIAGHNVDYLRMEK